MKPSVSVTNAEVIANSTPVHMLTESQHWSMSSAVLHIACGMDYDKDGSLFTTDHEE